MASAGTKWLLVLWAGGAVMVPSFGQAHALFFGDICEGPAGIIDIIDCCNAADDNGLRGPAVVSYVLDKLAPYASVALRSNGRPVTVTCRRIASVAGSQRRFPMDKPAPVE